MSVPRVTAGLLAFAGVLGGAGLSGCAGDPARGYSFADPVAGEHRSVHVAIFANQTMYPGIEFVVSEAVAKELQRSTRLAVTGEGADTTLTGLVRNVELRRVTRDSSAGTSDVEAVRITVDFTWRDRTGRAMVQRQNFSAVETFVAARGTGERLEVGERGAAARLARDLVAELRSSW